MQILTSRRRIVAAMAVFAFTPKPVLAQLNAGCEYSITNGLVTIGGADCELAVPGHMIDATADPLDDAAAVADTETLQERRQAHLQRHRDHTHEKRSRRTQRRHEQRDRHH